MLRFIGALDENGLSGIDTGQPPQFFSEGIKGNRGGAIERIPVREHVDPARRDSRPLLLGATEVTPSCAREGANSLAPCPYWPAKGLFQ